MKAILRAIRTILGSLFFAALAILVFYANKWGHAYYKGPETVTEVVEKIVEIPVPEEQAPLEELVSKYAKHYALPEVLLYAIIKTESNFNERAVRFEAHHVKRIPKKITNDTDRKMYSTSYGLFQVMGWHALSRELHWSDLLDRETNVRVGADILANCFNKAKGDVVTRTRAALGCYNGDPNKYPSLVMANLGEIALLRDIEEHM